MKKEKISITEVLRKERDKSDSNKEVSDFEGDIEEIETQIEQDRFKDVKVDYSRFNVDAIEIPVINDEHGRISDVIEAIEDETGLSVIPFSMAKIAPEVMSLSRHSIYELNGHRFAMSHRIRNKEMSKLENEIVRTLSSALPFEKILNTIVTYKGVDYETLSLSQDEWEFTLARFRTYKQEFGMTQDNKLVMHIFAERVSD